MGEGIVKLEIIRGPYPCDELSPCPALVWQPWRHLQEASPGGISRYAQGGSPRGVDVQGRGSVSPWHGKAGVGVPRFTQVGVLSGDPCWAHTFFQLAQLHPDYIDGFLQRHLKRLWRLPDVQVRQCSSLQSPNLNPTLLHPQLPRFPLQHIWIQYTHPGVSCIPKYPLKVPDSLYAEASMPSGFPKYRFTPPQTSINLIVPNPHSCPPYPIPHISSPYKLLLTYFLLLLQKMQGIHDDLPKCLTLI